MNSKPEVGQRIRFAIQYGGAWRRLGWIRADTDGSIHAGVLPGRPASAEAADTPATKRAGIEYRDLGRLEETPKSSRFSWHPSGEVHIGDRTGTGAGRLAKLPGPVQLCSMTFMHPGNYEPPDTNPGNEFDLGIIGYEVQEERPMYGAIIVAPWTAHAQLPATLPRMTHYVGAAVGLRGFTRTPDLLISVLVGDGPQGPWPELPGAAVIYSNGSK